MSTQPVLTREEATERLRAAEVEIRSFGVRRLALFGSVVRNEATPTSDVDVLVEFEPAAKTLDNVMGLADFLDQVFGCGRMSSPRSRSAVTSGPTSCARQRMSFAPLDYVRHMRDESPFLAG